MASGKAVSSKTAWIILGMFGLAAVVTVIAGGGDLLTAGALKSGGARIKVSQGAELTVAVKDSDQYRKIEVCTANQHIFGWYTDYVNCKTLVSNLEPHTRTASVTIPRDFTLERAAIIVRMRNEDGTLVDHTPADEKISLWITKGTFAPTPTPTPAGYRESFR